MTEDGRFIVRRPAAVFGGPSCNLLPTSTMLFATRIVPATVSMMMLRLPFRTSDVGFTSPIGYS
jgi:hypothetical protein